MDVNPVVVSVIVVPPACAPAETADAPNTVKLSVSAPVEVTVLSKVSTIVLRAVLSAVNVGAVESALTLLSTGMVCSPHKS